MATEQVERLYKLTVDAKGAIAQLEKLNKQTAETNKSLGAIGSIAKKFAAFAGAKLSIQGLQQALQKLVNSAKEMENLRTQLESYASTAGQASVEFDKIYKASQNSTVSIGQMTRAYVNLNNSGVQPTTEMMRAFNSIAAASSDSAGAFTAATDLVTRTVSGGLGLEDLNRLVDRGIPAFDILKEKLGVNRLELAKFGASAEGASKVVQALVQGVNEKFSGLNDVKLDTVETHMKNLSDSTSRMLANFSDSSGLTTAFKEIAEFINAQNNSYIKATQGAADYENELRKLETRMKTGSNESERLASMKEELSTMKEGTEAYKQQESAIKGIQDARKEQSAYVEFLGKQLEIENKIKDIKEHAKTSNWYNPENDAKRTKVLQAALEDLRKEYVALHGETQKADSSVVLPVTEADLKRIEDLKHSLEEAGKTKLTKLHEQVESLTATLNKMSESGLYSAKQIKLVQDAITQAKGAENTELLKQQKARQAVLTGLQTSVDGLNSKTDKYTDLENRVAAAVKAHNVSLEDQKRLNKEIEDARDDAKLEAERQKRIKAIQDEKDAAASFYDELNPKIKTWQTEMDKNDKYLRDHAISLEKYRKNQEAIQKNYADTSPFGQDQISTLTEFDKMVDELNDKVGSLVVDGIDKLGDAFTDLMVTGTDNFSKLTTSILNDIAKMIIKITVMNNITGAIKGLLPESWTTTSSLPVPGASIGGEVITPFAGVGQFDSGVANINSLLSTSISNLSRGGGSTQSSAPIVNINNYGSSTVSQKSTTDSDGQQQINIIVRDAFHKQVNAGEHDDLFQSTYGMTRRGY